MQEKDLFEYAVIRLVPRVEREEFINVGVILYCKKQRFLNTLWHIELQKVKALCVDIEIDLVEENLDAMAKICVGNGQGGPIGQLDMASRFRWLTATRSTVIQSSKVHPGYCENAKEKLVQLFEQMVK